jgi:hypothetical protein
VSWLAKSRRRWFLLAALWVLIMVLGVGGYREQAAASGQPAGLLDTFYQTLQLAALQFKGDADNMNWRLQVVRFVAPVMAAGTLVQAASVVFEEQLRRLRAARARGHTVVVGSGEVADRFVRALRDGGDRVVAVSRTSPSSGTSREFAVPLVVGDPTDPGTLLAARADRADRLLLVDADDGANVDTAQAARGLRRRSGRPLRITARLSNAGLAALLRGQDLAADNAARVDFVNLHEAGARRWMAEHRLPAQPRPLIVGLGQLGRSPVLAVAQLWAAQGLAAAGPLPIVLVDRVASGRWQALRWQHPALDGALEPTPIDLDLTSPTAEGVERLHRALADWRPNWVGIALQDESLAVSAALLLADGMVRPPDAFVVRTRADAGLARLLTMARAGTGAPAALRHGMGLSVFPYLDRTCTAAVVDSGPREQLARALHEDYLSRSTSGSEAGRPWEELSDAEREDSRRQVDDLIAAFGSIGCDLLPLRSWGAPAAPLTEDEVAELARREHERWRADRISAGWSYGPVRDNAARRNPLLVPFADLPEAVQEQNRQTITALPALLARAGFEPVRRAEPDQDRTAMAPAAG